MKPKNQILTRMYMVLTLLGIVPILIVGQIVRIYITQGSELQASGERQARSSVNIPAMRGAILDQSGRALAINTARYDLALDPTIDGFDEQAAAFFDKLSSLTGISAASFRRRVARRSSPQYVMLYRGMDGRHRETVESWDVPGLILTPKFARRYNYGGMAAHALGHISTDGHGLAGLEKQYDEYLTGEPGRRAVKRDRYGNIKAFVGGRVVPPKHGENLVLTIDLVRQAAMEDELARGVQESGAAWGTAIAMDPHTGAILGLANVPTYDPNHAAAYSDAARRNRAITDQIEPGSIFKLVSAAAMLEQDVIALDDTVDTGDGWTVFHGHTMKDIHAYGKISFADVIVKSSNVGIAKTATRLEEGTLYQYARNLGFGQPTWIDLPGEVDGVLKKPAQWSSTTLTSMSIGYEVAATPIQLLAAYSALANGGLLVQPYIVAERQDMTGETIWTNRADSVRRALRTETVVALRPVFERVVKEGTATEAHVKNLSVAGKTGTARVATGGGYNQRSYRASFAGFYPADAPEVAMIVIIGQPKESIYGGAVAAPIFQRITRRWAGTLPRVRDYVARADTSNQMMAEDVPPPVQHAALADLNIANPTTMPDLRGHSARQAAHWLRAQGVRVQVNGHGTVQDQYPEAGTTLPRQATLRCQ